MSNLKVDLHQSLENLIIWFVWCHLCWDFMLRENMIISVDLEQWHCRGKELWKLWFIDRLHVNHQFILQTSKLHFCMTNWHTLSNHNSIDSKGLPYIYITSTGPVTIHLSTYSEWINVFIYHIYTTDCWVPYLQWVNFHLKMTISYCLWC